MTWWKSGVIYQIYPRSFMDSNGDGVGDLAGIVSRLDYLKWLGVDAIWMSPFYPSPMHDFGYDVADYTNIDPLFGTLADFDRLAAEANARGLKLILDFVPNHTSIKHPWFAEARGSRRNAKRDWYIWHDPAPGGGPPNNWLSVFGGSAWEYDQATEQYYYHAFLKEQPDLNWRNPQVRRAMYDVLRFWLARGANGFRVDVLWHLIKDAAFRDEPEYAGWTDGDDPYFRLEHIYSCDQPEMADLVAEMRGVIDEKPDSLFIGEIYLPIERLVAYYGAKGEGAHLPFNFHLISMVWRADALAALIQRYEEALPPGAWPNWVLGNHDRMRIASRIGGAQARNAAMLLCTLRGTPTLYYGDELGLENVAIPPALVQDPWEKNVPGLGLGRDPVRTPMPWNDAASAGFTAGIPWLPLNADYATRNVESRAQDQTSLLTLYRSLLALRRKSSALQEGTIAVRAESSLLVYERAVERERLVIALNLSGERRFVAIAGTGELVLSTSLTRDRERVKGNVALAPDEGVIIRLTTR